MRKIRFIMLTALALTLFGNVAHADDMAEENKADKKSAGVQEMEKATFGGGCFWGVEAAFRQINGVVSTSVGYIGGDKENPTYEEVGSKSTGHAEAVEVTFDPTRVSYERLLKTFWTNHDPTQLNRQGPDIGSQYRSAIFYHSDDQKASAEKSIEVLTEQGVFQRPIVTEIVSAGRYYLAEDYHQQYLEKRGLSTCGIKNP